MLFKKVIVIALSGILAMPLVGQRVGTVSPEIPAPDYGPVSQMARLAQAQAPTPQPGQVAAPAEPAAKKAQAAPAKPPGVLKVVVVDGDGATNDVRTGQAVSPKVRVLDEKGNPVGGAEVVFSLPMGGPSGTFNGWVRTQTLRTDDSGLAVASGFAPNETEGSFAIKVNATSGNNRGSATISQTNVKSASTKSNKKTWIIMGAAAAAAAIAIIVAATGDNNETLPGQDNPVVITPGSITVGGPK